MVTDATPGAVVRWQEWGTPAFACALAERKPVLLSITAAWCHGCVVMDRTTYADEAIVDLINGEFVPIRVDADRRPDINDRYHLDGWPTTAFLTPSGEILSGSTYLPPAEMTRAMTDVLQAFHERYDELMRRAGGLAHERTGQRPRTVPSGPDLDAESWVTQRVVAECDWQHGGFGEAGKFLHLAALSVALARFERTDDERLGAAILSTLDGMSAGSIFDEVEGGVFRYAAGRDWSKPHTEKMLEDQVGIVRVLLGAARVFSRDDYRSRAIDVIRYVHTTLADGAGDGFFASQLADEGYYLLGSAAIRRTLEPPAVDRTLFTDVNALAADAWLEASATLGDPSLGEFAVRSLERVVVPSYQPGGGVGHYVTDSPHSARSTPGLVRGLLTDQVHAAAASLRVHERTDNPTWSMLAEELMRFALRSLWDEQGGGFFDRVQGPEDVGLLREPLKPLAPNCLAARVLSRLSRITGDASLQQRAIETLQAQTAVYRTLGLGGAPYALAVTELLPEGR
jgi:uncharacterized protein